MQGRALPQRCGHVLWSSGRPCPSPSPMRLLQGLRGLHRPRSRKPKRWKDFTSNEAKGPTALRMSQEQTWQCPDQSHLRTRTQERQGPGVAPRSSGQVGAPTLPRCPSRHGQPTEPRGSHTTPLPQGLGPTSLCKLRPPRGSVGCRGPGKGHGDMGSRQRSWLLGTAPATHCLSDADLGPALAVVPCWALGHERVCRRQVPNRGSR